MKIFRILPNQHGKEITLVEAENEIKALELAQGLYGKPVSIREIEYYFGE